MNQKPDQHRPSRKGVEITPHKGGRTIIISGQRATPEVAQKFEQIAAITGETKADLLERLILAEWARLFSNTASNAKTESKVQQDPEPKPAPEPEEEQEKAKYWTLYDRWSADADMPPMIQIDKDGNEIKPGEQNKPG